MVAFATQVKRRRGTTAQNDAFTGAEGEIVVDTQRHELRVHDGVTRGGFKIGGDKANVGLDNLTSAGKEFIAHQAMPSSRYVDLTLGASGTQYTAPADGYLSCVLSTTTNGYISMYSAYWQNGTVDGAYTGGIVSIRAGASIGVFYEGLLQVVEFRFRYAVGAE